MISPRTVVTAAFEALTLNDYRALAALCDPLSLLSFKTEMLEEFGDDVGVSYPDASTSTMEPIELTDAEYAEYCELFDPVRRMQSEFPKLSSLAEFRELDPVDAFASWIEARTPERYLEGSSPRKPWEVSSQWKPDVRSSTRRRGWPRYVIIGCLFDSADIAHVLYRNELSPAEVFPEAYASSLATAPAACRDFMVAMHHRGDPILITCRRQDDGSWRLVAKRHFMLFGSLQVTEIRFDE